MAFDQKAYRQTPQYKLKNRERTRARQRSGLPVPTRPEVLCEMCGRHGGKRSLHLDHCHATGVFRGWLCAACNLWLGRMGDDLDAVIEKLTAYRDKFASEAFLAIPGDGLPHDQSWRQGVKRSE